MNENQIITAALMGYLIGDIMPELSTLKAVELCRSATEAFLQKYPEGYDWEKHSEIHGTDWVETAFLFLEEFLTNF